MFTLMDFFSDEPFIGPNATSKFAFWFVLKNFPVLSERFLANFQLQLEKYAFNWKTCWDILKEDKIS